VVRVVVIEVVDEVVRWFSFYEEERELEERELEERVVEETEVEERVVEEDNAW